MSFLPAIIKRAVQVLAVVLLLGGLAVSVRSTFAAWPDKGGSISTGTNNDYSGSAPLRKDANANAAPVEGTATPTATSTPDPCGLAWRIVTSPNQGVSTTLDAVAAVNSDDVWAVGFYQDSTSHTNRTLTEHWDGSTWSIVSSPNQGNSVNYLYGVAALSSDDVWAVGYYSNGSAYQTLTEHWNGTSWSIVSSPNQGTNNSSLNGVAAVSSNDLWAVGYYNDGNANQTLVEHWNGTAWSVVPSPNQSTTDNYLYSVAAVGSSDVWAVGEYTNSDGYYQTLTEHWNGTAWSVVPSPNQGTENSELFAVAAVATDDVWAVGDYYNTTSSVNETLIEHWNGSAWAIVSSPNSGTSSNYLASVSAANSSDVWAVGYYRSGSTYQTLTEHWNGSAWTVVSSPNQNAGIQTNYLYGVAVVGSNDVWAVGQDSTANTSLIEHYNDPCVTPTSTATATATQTNTATPTQTATQTATSTLTSVPATSTATASASATRTGTNTATNTVTSTGTSVPVNTSTSTAAASATRTVTTTATPPVPPASATSTATAATCTSSYSDVSAGSTYYSFIACLSCRGAISGYPDGTYRENVPMTRGQIAKIVSQAAGFQEDPGSQIYSDVPPGSTYYPYINRLTRRGIVAGYPCPTRPGESRANGTPCTPENPSLFRPEQNTTRGQMAKIVSNAAGYNEDVSGQYYADVPPTGEGSQFYTWIMRLTNRGVMSGYRCGATDPRSGPCDAQHRPYFRPGNEVTRGQAAKIVANTFFPNCQSPASQQASGRK